MTDSSNSTKEKPIILIVCNYYLPGYKAGGGLRTIVHTVERFRDRFDFRIITFDHDGDGKSYDSVKIDQWNAVEGAQVFYLPKNKVKLSKLRELVAEVNPKVIYLNSVFSKLTIFILTLRRLKLLKASPVILAPEGELSVGALKLKAKKKSAFVKFAKKTNLYKDLIWKVTAEPEKAETEQFKGSAGSIFVAPNMPSKSLFETYNQELRLIKNQGEANMIFLSRFARKKNLKWLLENLETINGKLTLDVYGPLEDEIYWKETQSVISKLPTNIKVNYKGQVTHEKVLETLFKYHFFVLPTLGENFGHVFVEALAAGCPLIISDRTPWRDLKEKNIGWDLPLEKPAIWNQTMASCIEMDNAAYRRLSSNAREFAYRWLTDPKIEEDTLKVLLYGIEKASTKGG